MNNLLDIASEVMEGFNPATDSADDFEKLPDGVYLCVLEDVTHKSNEKGTEWISFKYTVMDGDYENKCIYANYFFTEKTVKRSIKLLGKVAYAFGYELPLQAFENLDTLAESLNNMAGNQANVEQVTKNDYSNYTITPVE